MHFTGPIRVISDLHLGHPACRIQSVEQLCPLIDGAGTVVFNGDTIEQRSPELAERSEVLFEQLQTLLNEQNVEAVFLRGNHDPQVSEMDYLDIPEYQALIVHGDCLYRNISPWNPKIWKLEAEFAKLAESLFSTPGSPDFPSLLNYTQQCRLLAKGDEGRSLPGRFKKIRSAIRLVYPFRRPIEVVRCWREHGKRLRMFHQQHAADKNYVLVGHVHRRGIYPLDESGKRWGINTGGFLSLGKAQVVEFSGAETGEPRVVVFEVDERSTGIRLGAQKVVG